MLCRSSVTFVPYRLLTSHHFISERRYLATCSANSLAKVQSNTTCSPAQLPHEPVLKNQVLTYLLDNPKSVDTFLDCTLGAGGHAHHILSSSCSNISTYIGIDKDPQALKLASNTLLPFADQIFLQYHHADFRTLNHCVCTGIDAALLDVGVSSMQLDTPTRGFSFMQDGPLDMRMNSADSTTPTAADILAMISQEKLEQLLRTWGEEPVARRIANAIVQERTLNPITSTKQLAELVSNVKGRRRKYTNIHPATLTFQALRIAVNGELDALHDGIVHAINALNPGGRLAVISFHSLEDRIVKNLFKDLSTQKGGVKILTKKPVTANDDEIKVNLRSRSAKMRVVEKLKPDQIPIIGKVNKYKPPVINSG